MFSLAFRAWVVGLMFRAWGRWVLLFRVECCRAFKSCVSGYQVSGCTLNPKR